MSATRGSIADVLARRAQWAVANADCLQLLPMLPDMAVGSVICDPPFTDRTSKNARTNNNWLPQSEAHSFITFSGINPAAVAPAIVRVAARWAVAFCALEQLGDYERAAGDAWIRAGVWGKPDGAPQFTGDRPAQSAEGVAIMHRPGRKKWNGGGSRGLWLESVVQDRAEFDHPTPKPLELMLRLVELFTEPGEVVCDPFCGSGTTGVACLRLGRRFIGCEVDERHHAVAAARISAESRGQTLREFRAGQLSLLADGVR